MVFLLFIVAWGPLLTPYRHVDGHDYMYAVSEMLDSAKHAIFILVIMTLTLCQPRTDMEF